MKPLTIISVLMTAVPFTMTPGAVFAANEDPLFCSCVPVDDDGSTLATIEAQCAEKSNEDGYDRWRLRSPQKGEGFREIFAAPPFACNASINGVAVCEGASFGNLAEPIACIASPSME